eukprot:TRINITY_DN13243_c0_g4_i3.p1 TRINITY_DN13243_c0_g4~~TRINITY_DN13243_c0_g4_i3.p1  ORF type:complete len:635 (-),score=72.49 TRINITY_DN13243_c0_g4_i3:284-2188(-)
MNSLAEIPFYVYAILLAVAHLLNARLYKCEEVRKSIDQVTQSFLHCREGLKTFWTATLLWRRHLCSRRRLSEREEQRRKKVEAQMQIKRRCLCDDVTKSLRRALSICLSIFCAFGLLSQYLLTMSSVTIVLKDDTTVFLSWCGLVVYLLCVLYELAAWAGWKRLWNVDVVLTIYVVIITALVSMWSSRSDVFETTIARCCFFFPVMCYVDPKKVLAASAFFGLAQGAAAQRDNAPASFAAVMWLGTSIAFLSWFLGFHFRTQVELVLMNSQLRSGRKSLGAFLTAAFDVYFQVDSRLRIVGPVPELSDFLKLQLSAANVNGTMDGVPLLNIVSRDEREHLRTFLSRTAEGASIAATTNMNILFGDGTIARSQLFHCVDDDLFEGLTHWVGLRQLGETPGNAQSVVPMGVVAVAPTGTPSSTPNLATGQIQSLVTKPPPQSQQLDDASSVSVSHRAPSSTSSSSSSACKSVPSSSRKKPASVTLRFDASEESLNVLSFQVDLCPAGAAGAASLTQSIKEGMAPHDWRVMQGWLEDSGPRLVAGGNPSVLPDVLMQLKGLDIVLMAAQASLVLEDCSGHAGRVFAMKLESPNILPMSELRAAATKDAKRRYVAGQALGRVEEVNEESSQEVKKIAL